MGSLLGSLALAYVAGSGACTNAAVVGRGLVRATRTAVAGEYREAAIEAAGALVVPALMVYGSMAALVMDIVEAAQEVSGPVLEEATERRAFGRAA